MSSKRPPLGVRLTVDVEEIRAPRGTVWWARVRWHDPESGRRETIKRSHPTREAADAWSRRCRTRRGRVSTGRRHWPST
jgi:hypothetical protein